MSKSPQILKRQSARKALILELVRKAPEASRTSIQKSAHLSMETVLGLVDELIADGLLVESGKSDAPVGRKAMLLKINPDGCYDIGIRFNANYVVGVAMNFERQVVVKVQKPLPATADTHIIITQIQDCIHTVLDDLGPKAARVKGIGIGTPGIVDISHGVVRRYVHISDWVNVPLKELLEAHFSIPVYIEHGVKCTACALRARPEYAAHRNLVLVQLNRGVNMCFLADGKLYHGSTNISGEIGHVHVADNGIRCGCGHTGCLETVAADQALLERVQAGVKQGRFRAIARELAAGEPLRIGLLWQAAQVRDPDALALLKQVGEYIGDVLGSVITLLNPSCLVISGDISDSPDFREALKSRLEIRCLTECMDALSIVYERDDDLFDALGAAQLAYDHRYMIRNVL